jgi:hypothetical protein
MTPPISSTSSVSSVDSDFPRQPINLRTRLSAEVAAIGDALQQWPHNDDFKRSIATWHARLFIAMELKNVDPQSILDRFIPLLQEILVDSAFSQEVNGEPRWYPLREDALLGSDGNVYGTIPLRLYLYDSSEPYKYRSPLNPEDETAFVTQPHHLAAHLARWLQRHGSALELPAEVEQSYNALLQQGVLPPVPTPATERARHIRQARAQQRAKETNTLQNNLQAFKNKLDEEEASIKQAIKEGLEDPLNEMMQDQNAKHNAQLDAGAAQTKALGDTISADLNRVQAELSCLIKNNNRLREELSTVNQEIMTTQEQNKKCDLLIGEVKEAIQRRKEGKLLQILATVAVMTACAVATYGMSTGFQAAGVSAKACVTPGVKGAFQLTLNLI